MKNQHLVWLMMLTLAFWLIFVVVHLLLLAPDHKSSGTDLFLFYALVLLAMECGILAYYFFSRRK